MGDREALCLGESCSLSRDTYLGDPAAAGPATKRGFEITAATAIRDPRARARYRKNSRREKGRKGGDPLSTAGRRSTTATNNKMSTAIML